MSKQVKPRLCELIPTPKGSQKAESRNLAFAFCLFCAICKKTRCVRGKRDKEWENRVSAPKGQSRELADAVSVGGHHGPAISRTQWGGRTDRRDWGK